MPTPYSAVVPHYVKCFTEYMRAAGCFCTNNEKTDYQFEAPLTAWDECSAEAHWRNRPNPDQPFFAVFNPFRTHESGMWFEKCPQPTFNPNEMPIPPYFPDTPKVWEAMARMYTHIERSDHELGELLQQLEADGLDDNTYIFHWSDHGPLPRGKRWPYDSGIRVPLITRGPGIPAGQVMDDLVSTIDLGPTMLSLVDIDIPMHMQGRAFLGPQAAGSREYVYATRDRHIEPAIGTAPFRSPMLFQLHCATQGASITYTFESGDAPHWLLYTQPLRIESGKTLLRAKAIRIGYRVSAETQINIVAGAAPSVSDDALQRA